MKIMRASKSFRTGSSVSGARGAHEGDLVPGSHPLVKKFPQMFEDVEAYVTRRHPDLVEQPERKRRGRSKTKSQPEPVPAEPAAPPEAQEEKVPDGEE